MFAGLVPPTGGEVSVAGVPPGEAVRQRRVGMVFQEAALMPWKTALENVCSLMALVDAAPRERNATARWNCCAWSAWSTRPTGIRRSCPAACASAYRSHGHWRWIPRC